MSDLDSAVPFPFTSIALSNQVASNLWGMRRRDGYGNEFQLVLVRGSTVQTFHGGGAFWHTASNVLTGYTVTPDVSQAGSTQAPAGIFLYSLTAAQVNAGNRLAWVLKRGRPDKAGLRAIVTNGKAGAGDYLVISASDGRFTGFNPGSTTGATNAAAGLRNLGEKIAIFTPSADGTTSLITSTRLPAVRVNCP